MDFWGGVWGWGGGVAFFGVGGCRVFLGGGLLNTHSCWA
jgi:hypothetical protein